MTYRNTGKLFIVIRYAVICSYMTMEEYDHSYAGKNAINESWANSFRNMNFRSTNVSPKVSARNSCTGDSMGTSVDYHDVFGGPPKYVSLKQKACQSPRKLHSLFETGLPSSGFSLPSFEIPVFGESVAARRRFVNDEFYDDIFNGDKISNASERSEICSASSRSASRNLSPVRHPLPRKSEYKSFSSAGSPLAPKSRLSANSSKTSDHPILHISPQRDRYKYSNNVSISSSVKSSPRTDSLDLLETPFGRCQKSKKKFPYGKEGLKIDAIFGGFRRRSSKSRSQSFLEQGESLNSSLRESVDTENVEDICSAPQNTSCSITSDDDWWGNTPRRIHENNSELAERVANGLEKARLSTNDVQQMRRSECLGVSSPRASHGQQKVKCWRDWISGPKGLHSHGDSGLSPVNSMGSSVRRSNIRASNAQEEAQLKLGLRSIDTQGIDSGEESDEFGSFVIEIDLERKETFAFDPEKDIQVDNSSDVLSTPIKETMTYATEKSQCWNEKRGLLKVNMPAKDVSQDKFRGIPAPKKWTRAGNHDPVGNKETSMRGSNVSGNVRQLTEWFARAMPAEEKARCGKIEVQRKMHSATVLSVPVDDQGKCIKEGKKLVVQDGCLEETCLGLPAVAMEVSDKAQRWSRDRPFVICQETLQESKSNKRPESCSGQFSDKASRRETSESWRKQWEMEGQRKINDHVAKKLVETKLDGLQAEAENHKSFETLDGEVRRWSAGKDANIRALLSTLQYVLWEESGWKPVPLIEIIEGAAVKKAYQKARLCVHPDKLQQKGATAQQKYIAKKVFDVLQAAWTIFNSMDPL